MFWEAKVYRGHKDKAADSPAIQYGLKPDHDWELTVAFEKKGEDAVVLADSCSSTGFLVRGDGPTAFKFGYLVANLLLDEDMHRVVVFMVCRKKKSVAPFPTKITVHPLGEGMKEFLTLANNLGNTFDTDSYDWLTLELTAQEEEEV